MWKGPFQHQLEGKSSLIKEESVNQKAINPHFSTVAWGPRKEQLGEGLAEKVGRGLAKGWQRHSPILQVPKRLFRRVGLWLHQGRKQYTPPPWKPSFFFRGLRLYGVYLSFRTYGAYPFFLFSHENGIHHSFFCSVTSGSGDRPRKEGCHGGGVYSFFPCPWINFLY